jgi:biotin synthase-like enzyme
VLEAARKAKENGSTRFCMGAAWRDLSGRKRGFERILEMVREIRKMDMEVCTTLGMLSPTQAKQLKEACVSPFQIGRTTRFADTSANTRGLTAYNHNLDTSREYYPKAGLPLFPMPANLSHSLRRSSLQELTTTAWTRYLTSEKQASVSVRAASSG